MGGCSSHCPVGADVPAWASLTFELINVVSLSASVQSCEDSDVMHITAHAVRNVFIEHTDTTDELGDVIRVHQDMCVTQ